MGRVCESRSTEGSAYYCMFRSCQDAGHCTDPLPPATPEDWQDPSLWRPGPLFACLCGTTVGWDSGQPPLLREYRAGRPAHSCEERARLGQGNVLVTPRLPDARPGLVGQYDPSSPYEPIKIIEHHNLNFALGNVIKYVLRAGRKMSVTTSEGADIEDLEKARQYIDFEIARRRRVAQQKE